MNRKAIQAMLRLADAFDSKGDTESANAIEQLLSGLTGKQKSKTSGIVGTSTLSPVHAKQIANALVRVADSLDHKGAHREAQMADNLLTELTDVMQQPSIQPSSIEPVMQMPSAEEIVSVEPAIEEHNEAPFLPEAEIETPQSIEPEFDEIDLNDLDELINSMRLTHSQRAKREQYQRVLEKARQAKEYKDAADAWLNSAHEDFGDDPIRIKI